MIFSYMYIIITFKTGHENVVLATNIGLFSCLIKDCHHCKIKPSNKNVILYFSFVSRVFRYLIEQPKEAYILTQIAQAFSSLHSQRTRRSVDRSASSMLSLILFLSLISSFQFFSYMSLYVSWRLLFYLFLSVTTFFPPFNKENDSLSLLSHLIFTYQAHKKSKVGDHNRGRSEGSLFNIYYA